MTRWDQPSCYLRKTFSDRINELQKRTSELTALSIRFYSLEVFSLGTYCIQDLDSPETIQHLENNVRWVIKEIHADILKVWQWDFNICVYMYCVTRGLLSKSCLNIKLHSVIFVRSLPVLRWRLNARNHI